MKLFENKEIPARTERRVVRRQCDLCGCKSTGDDWDAGIWEVNDTEIKVTITQKDGTNYPEGGSGNEYEIDLCPSCFKDRLVPWLIQQGASIKRREWDW